MHEELDVGPGELPGYRFRTALNGYDRREVDTLLHAVASNWERQRRALEAEISTLRSGQSTPSGDSPRLSSGRVGGEVEAILERAREVGDEIVEAAREEQRAAEQLVLDAQTRATEIVAQARTEAREAHRDAEAEYEELLERSTALRAALRAVVEDAHELAERLPETQTATSGTGGSEAGEMRSLSEETAVLSPPASSDVDSAPEAAGITDSTDEAPAEEVADEEHAEEHAEESSAGAQPGGLRRLLHHN